MALDAAQPVALVEECAATGRVARVLGGEGQVGLWRGRLRGGDKQPPSGRARRDPRRRAATARRRRATADLPALRSGAGPRRGCGRSPSSTPRGGSRPCPRARPGTRRAPRASGIWARAASSRRPRLGIAISGQELGECRLRARGGRVQATARRRSSGEARSASRNRASRPASPPMAARARRRPTWLRRRWRRRSPPGGIPRGRTSAAPARQRPQSSGASLAARLFKASRTALATSSPPTRSAAAIASALSSGSAPGSRRHVRDQPARALVAERPRGPRARPGGRPDRARHGTGAERRRGISGPGLFEPLHAC